MADKKVSTTFSRYLPLNSTFLPLLFAFGKKMCYIWETLKTETDMIEKLDYAMVPHKFAHCFNGNCKHADHCLRHQIVRFIPDSLWSVSIVNPARTDPDGECEAFMADTPVQYAVGMDHLLDRIPHQEATSIKQRLLATYGKNKFYQFKRKERTFTPEEQGYIRQVFLSYGVKDDPVFDAWQTGYQWI